MQASIVTVRRCPSHTGEIGATASRRSLRGAIAIAILCAIGFVGVDVVPADAATSESAAPDSTTPDDAPGTAAPAPEPSPSPSAPTPSPMAPTPGPVAPAPTTIAISPEGFSPTGYAAVRGTAQADSRVVVTAAGGEICAVQASADGVFDCGSVPVPDGDDIEIVATESRSTGSPTPEAASTRIDVLRPPLIDGANALLTTGLVSGTGRPGATVTVSVDGAADAACTSIPVPASAYWSCNLSRASGTYTMRAQQSDSEIANGTASGYSSVQTVTVDRDPPAAAVITSPAPGAVVPGPSITVSGSGESGSAVDVYLDDVPACAASVVGARWSCEAGGLARGAHELQAITRDAAGNYASPSAPVGIIVAAGAASGPSVGPTPTPAAPAEPGPAAPPPGGDQPAPGEAPGPPVAGGPSQPFHDGWSSPTGFGGGIRSLADSVTTSNWFASPLVALLFVALIAIPLRMLATSLRGRVALPALTGRNRSRRASARTDDASSLPRTRSVVPVAVAVAAALVLVSVGIAGEVRYLRLYLAVAAGLAVLNIVGGIVATRVGARAAGIRTTVRFLPLMLAAAAFSAVVSRMTGIEPPIITGVLLGVAFAAGATVRQRAAVSISQVGAVAALGLLGWVLLGAAVPAAGFWAVAANEVLATVCLAGLGSALVLVLPIASLPGRVILEWSPTAWIVTTLAVSTAAAWTVFGGILVGLPVTPWLLAAASFAALSVAIWAYVRFVEPARA